ncbi:target of Nesh-SH3 [Terrapene carolina triunguis]|uniref:target of Nesh-SH3 n=1 Tax=Terrapene triunguis TaxID=2587831 RepID=UPI0011568A0C|nr:target of Nesh-SH3 [Terrapene carolina triunguis]
MISRLVFLLFCGHIALNLGNAQKLPRVKRQNLKVQINATDDTICMKYLRLSPDTKLQGFILGYGSSFFSNQYIPLPSEGKSYVTEVDAEPRYLITVRPAPIPNHKKTCSGLRVSQLFLSAHHLLESNHIYIYRQSLDLRHNWFLKIVSCKHTIRKPSVFAMDTDKKQPFAKRSASWSQEHNQILVNFWCEVSKTVDFGKSSRNSHTIRKIAKKLAALQIYWTGDQCREQIKLLKTEYRKTRDQNGTSGNLPTSCPFYEEFDQVLGSARSLEPVVVHDDPVSQDGALMAPEYKFYTVRYREKDKNKNWGFQLCPTTETVVENLKPNTPYEFGVKDNTEDGIWSKIFNHKTILFNKNKENGQLQNTYKVIPNIQTQVILRDAAKLVPITRIKEVIQNVTRRMLPKTTDRSSLPGAILVHLIIPGLNETPQQKLPKPETLGISETPKKILVTNETRTWPAESKTPEVQEISPWVFPATLESVQESIKPTVSAASEKSEASPAHSKNELESAEPSIAPTTELPLNTLAHSETDSGLEETKSIPKPDRAQTQNIPASNEMQLIPSGSKISDTPKILQTKPTTTKPALKSTSFPSTKTPGTVMAFDETQFVSSRSKPSGVPEKLPTKSVTIQTTPKPVTPEASKAEVATNSADLETSVPLISRIPHVLGTTMAFSDTHPVFSNPTTSDEPDRTDLKPAATSEPTLESFSPKTSSPLEWPRETLAPNEAPLIPSKLKPSPLPEVQHVKPAQKPPLWEHSTPKASKTIERPKATLAPWEKKFVPSTPKPSARPKMPRTKPAEKAIHLESNTPKFSNTLELPRTTLAPSKTKRIPSKPKVSLHPEEPKTKPAATRKPVPVPVTIKISSITATTKTLEHPKSTMVSYEPQHIPSKPKASASAMPEMPHSKPESSEIHFTPLKPKSSTEPKMPQSKPAPTETQFIPSKPNTSPEPELPHPKPVLEHITLRIEPPRSTIAPKETRRVPLKPKTSPKPHVPQTKPAPEAATFRTQQPKTPLAPKEAQRVPSKPKTSPSPDVPQTKPAPKEMRRVPSKPKTSPIPDVPPTKPAAKENRRVPSKPKTSPSPDVPQTKSVPKETQRVPSKLKTSPSPDVPHTKPAGVIRALQEPVTATTPHSLERAKATLASSEKPFIPTKPKTSIKPGIPQTKPAIHRTSPQPLITKPSVTSKQTKATMAPKETRLIPSKPKTSIGPEVLQTKPVPNETYQISFKPQTVLTTENPHLKTASYVIHTETIKPKISKPFGKTEATLAPHKVRLTSARPKIFDKPQTRPALNKTTPGPGRTKTAGAMRWGGTPTGDKETVQNFTNFLMGSNISLESNITWKNPDSVATAPDRRHPPLAPAKPTQVRRKPLPPNTVTGKPGSAGIALKSRAPPSPTTIVAKSTGPTISLRMETPRKKPTVSASPPEDYVNTTVFSSSPTSETDSLGKQRFTGPHVKYMPKNDSEPCSITRTLKYFQEKKISDMENATSPPQNPPSNLTVVTVEGCPSFVILNWTKPENDTVTYYVVLSTVNGTSNGTQRITVTTQQTHCIVENLEPNKSYEFQVKAKNIRGEGPSTPTLPFSTESADPRVSEPISMGKDAIWTEVPFNSNSYSECKGKQYVKRTWYKKFVGVQLCNSLRYKIYLSDSLTGQFYDIGDERGHGEDHCQFVDSFLDGRTGQKVFPDQLPTKDGFFRAVRQEPVKFGKIGGGTHIAYVHWYECGTSIPGKW